jgi:hypothetical protein
LKAGAALGARKPTSALTAASSLASAANADRKDRRHLQIGWQWPDDVDAGLGQVLEDLLRFDFQSRP